MCQVCDGEVTGIGEPFLQERFEFAHVLKAEIEGLKAGDGGLTEIITIQLAHSQSHITLQTERK